MSWYIWHWKRILAGHIFHFGIKLITKHLRTEDVYIKICVLVSFRFLFIISSLFVCFLIVYIYEGLSDSLFSSLSITWALWTVCPCQDNENDIMQSSSEHAGTHLDAPTHIRNSEVMTGFLSRVEDPDPGILDIAGRSRFKIPFKSNFFSEARFFPKNMYGFSPKCWSFIYVFSRFFCLACFHQIINHKT